MKTNQCKTYSLQSERCHSYSLCKGAILQLIYITMHTKMLNEKQHQKKVEVDLFEMTHYNQ